MEPQTEEAAEKVQNVVILSEAKNLSFILCLDFNRREVLRFAQNDKMKRFFRNLFSRCAFDFVVPTQTLSAPPLMPV
jgi:hypothetical protein